jgi:hypothetical protein
MAVSSISSSANETLVEIVNKVALSLRLGSLLSIYMLNDNIKYSDAPCSGGAVLVREDYVCK